jgi:hypothetical protein
MKLVHRFLDRVTEYVQYVWIHVSLYVLSLSSFPYIVSFPLLIWPPTVSKKQKMVTTGYSQMEVNRNLP